MAENIDIFNHREGPFVGATPEEAATKNEISKGLRTLRDRIGEIYSTTTEEGGVTTKQIHKHEDLSSDKQETGKRMSESSAEIKRLRREEDAIRSSGVPKEEIQQKVNELYGRMQEELKKWGI